LGSAADRLPAIELLKSPFILKDDIINDKTINPAQEPVAFPQNLDLDLDATPIFVSLLSNGTPGDGKESISLVLRRGVFVLEGDMRINDPVKLLLRIPVPNGNNCLNIKSSSLGQRNFHLYEYRRCILNFFCLITGKCKNIEFAFDLEKDTSLSVATEMVEELELPSWSMHAVAKLIDAFLLKTVRGWRPCVQVGQMIQAVLNTASADGT